MRARPARGRRGGAVIARRAVEGEATPEDRHHRAARWAVHPSIDLAGAYSWRLLGIAGVVVATMWLIGQLLPLLIPVIIAVLLARVLVPAAGWLRRHRWPPAVATLTVLLALLGSVAGSVAVVVPSIADEFHALGPTVSGGIDDLEGWIVDESPVEVTRADLEAYRAQLVERASEQFGGRQGPLASAAALAIEIPTGLVLALVLAFFFVKDGERMVAGAARLVPARHRPKAGAAATAAWETLGGYLRGALILGTVEALVMGTALALVGSDLAVPVMVVTFLGAFVPFIGAIVAGVVAVLVAFVSAGPTAALVVAVTAVMVQQFDGDLLAPFVYGHALQLHPVAVLSVVVAGGALFGFLGAVLAVPLLAIAVNTITSVRDVDVARSGPDGRE